jgi:iron complex outermembrane receptor protein
MSVFSNTNAKPLEFQVSGQIVDASDNEPIVGCIITIKGTSNGVSSDASGKYTISVPDENAVLIFSYIGYEKQEVAVNGKKEINISLKPSLSELSQVVVIGYGTTTKKDLTGAAKSLKSADLNRGIVNSPEQLLQGRVSGVNVISASGEPGSAQTITIRGASGVRTGNTPLYVIDGLALDNTSTGGAINPLSFINPQDIESIDVLKDASATAIYGARGANGVVFITTKKGKSGTSSVNFSTSLGFSQLARPLKVFTADEYRREVVNAGGTLDDKGANTDWQKEITRSALTQTHNLSLSGGSNKLTYYGAFGLQKQEGILKRSNLNIYSGRVNLTQKVWDDRLVIDVNLNASNTVNKRPPTSSLIGSAIIANPTYAPYDASGNPTFLTDITNPLLTLNLETDETVTNRVLGNITPSLTIIKGLVYKLNFGVDNSTSSRDLQSLPNLTPARDGRLESYYTSNRNTLIENYFTYTLSLSKHSLVALLGHSYQKVYLQGRSWSINKFPVSGVDPVYNPGQGQDLTLANNTPSGFATINELQSFFGRINYQFNNKYLATATVRVDGSTKFGDNKKYGTFPSFSLGWNIAEEEFLKNSLVSELKLRVGWGKTGNQEIPSKRTQALFITSTSGTTSYPLDNSTTYPAGITYARLANPDLQWESSVQTDLGLDFALFNGRLTGTIDAFNKVTNNVLLNTPTSDPIQPANETWRNIEDMKITNKGLEFELNYRHTFGNGLGFDVGGNMTFIDNKVTGSPYSVLPSGSASGSGLTGATINGYINNQPIGTFYMREFKGINESGLSIYTDIDGDGVITDKDRVVAGTALPNRQFNFNAGLNFKGFDFRINFNGVSGNKVYDNTALTNFYKTKISRGLNTTAEAVEYPNESINNGAPLSTRYLKNGAYLRLNNASLGYQIDPTLVGLNKWVSNIRLSVTGQNLLLFTKYDGYDPEVNTDKNLNQVLSYGIDYLSYPKPRTVIFGLNVTF